jgi:hypothetical protein
MCEFAAAAKHQIKISAMAPVIEKSRLPPVAPLGNGVRMDGHNNLGLRAIRFMIPD